MQKIIGLDIGSYSIKAVEIVNSYKSYEITNFYENIIPQIEELSPDIIIPSCMEQLFQENDMQADRIITAMPGQYISSRILPFNFSDPHKIEHAIVAELEDTVPFNLEDMVIDHQILGSLEERTMVLAVMTRKIFLASFLDHLQRVGIDPKLVDVDSLSFYNLSPYLDLEPEKSYALVDIGHEKTSVCLIRNGVLRMFRSINLGGRYLTEFLSRDLQINYNEAQRRKHQISQVLLRSVDSKLDASEADIADRLTSACTSILKELGRTIYAFKTWEKTPVERIYLSGGSSQIKDLPALISEHLELETVASPLGQSNLKIAPKLHERIPVMSQSIAIGMRAVSATKQHSQINMRRGSFSFVQDYESLFKQGSTIFKFLAVSLILLSVAYVAKFYTYQKQTEELQGLYRKELLNILPAKLKSKYKNRNFPSLRREAKAYIKNKTTRLIEATEGFIDLNSDSGPLVVLREISNGIPPEIKIEMTNFQYNTRADRSGKVQLRFEAESFGVVAELKKALEGIEALSEVVEVSSDNKPGTELIVAIFEAQYRGKPI